MAKKEGFAQNAFAVDWNKTRIKEAERREIGFISFLVFEDG